MLHEKEVYAYSVVIPIYNEQENLPELEHRLSQILQKLGEPYEVIFVNDGSNDDSSEILKGFTCKDARLKVVELSRNFGHQAAFYAGMHRATGKAVILMDGDLQDPPEILPQLINQWHQGYQVVYTIRQKRKEGLIKRAAYAAFYQLLQWIAYIDMPLASGDFALIDRSVISLLCSMPERNKFLRGLRSWVGFKQTGVIYEREARFAGQPKYTPSKLLKLALDGLISYSYIPLRISFIFGFIVSISSFLLSIIYLLQKILSHTYIPQGFTTTAIIILFLGGVQLISIGVVGEYIGRIYDEVKRRPEFIEQRIIGFE